jgi:dipeptidyl aminopeptidase/acylaminoacyl peptidase
MALYDSNLLTHSDLFACGIRAGAYNRTLTPFGFQSEQQELLRDLRGIQYDVSFYECKQNENSFA